MTQMFVAELVAATESADLVAVFDLVVRISILLLASAASIQSPSHSNADESKQS